MSRQTDEDVGNKIHSHAKPQTPSHSQVSIPVFIWTIILIEQGVAELHSGVVGVWLVPAWRCELIHQQSSCAVLQRICKDTHSCN